ncbi:hypothetical protein [Haladaptatus sp. W1]|uniref:hypothetical protein n=1 Tax=Haladaptatus sp. W1 TaxID=1897478 RepID=UPI001112D9F6|nr:hypothetical protein [Haladaptatus sp. W1]
MLANKHTLVVIVDNFHSFIEQATLQAIHPREIFFVRPLSRHFVIILAIALLIERAKRTVLLNLEIDGR